MYIRYFLSAFLLIISKILVYVLAPVLAMLVVKAEEGETTGYPSLIKGELRYFLIKPLRWLQTHDAPLDEYYYAKYYEGKWTEKFKDNKWFMRVCWLWRNPAYGVAHALGYSQRGISIKTKRDEMSLRNSGKNNTSKFSAKNNKGKKAFMIFKQIVYGKRCFEIYLGWKLFRNDPDEKCMLVARLKPFKNI